MEDIARLKRQEKNQRFLKSALKQDMLLWEKKAVYGGTPIVIGVDEAGRGPLAGPVVAGAVILNPLPSKRFVLPRYKHRLDDSKRLRPLQRKDAFKEISEKSIFKVGLKDHIFIDTENILKATILAMRQAVMAVIRKFCRLNNKKEAQIKKKICILVDGNIDIGLPYKSVPMVKGDSKSISIAAASIVAKVTRDRIMISYDRLYPGFGFSRHKGYGTRFHLDALTRYGPCQIHRRSFAPIKNLYSKRRQKWTICMKKQDKKEKN